MKNNGGLALILIEHFISIECFEWQFDKNSVMPDLRICSVINDGYCSEFQNLPLSKSMFFHERIDTELAQAMRNRVMDDV